MRIPEKSNGDMSAREFFVLVGLCVILAWVAWKVLMFVLLAEESGTHAPHATSLPTPPRITTSLVRK